MRKSYFAVLLSGVALLAGSSLGQIAGAEATNRIGLRFEDSAAYNNGATVDLKSVLLKKRIATKTDGSGSLSAILLLTNSEGLGCQADADRPLASETEFVVGISLYESFQAKEGPEKTILHQMLFGGAKSTGSTQSTTFRWEGDAAVLFRHGTGKPAWYTLAKGRAENGVTILEKDGRTVLAIDFADPKLRVEGQVLPHRCP